MIPSIRECYNQSVTDEKYHAFVSDLENYAGESIPFRIAETPVFVPANLKQKLIQACNDIISVIKQPNFKATSERAIPQGLKVPGNESNPLWMAFDFAVCKDANSQLEPQLIEMQGFPSL